MINPLAHATDYRYDELNRLLEEVNPEMIQPWDKRPKAWSTIMMKLDCD
jgi:hypothetical protein